MSSLSSILQSNKETFPKYKLLGLCTNASEDYILDVVIGYHYYSYALILLSYTYIVCPLPDNAIIHIYQGLFKNKVSMLQDFCAQS